MRPFRVESLVQDNFLIFILGKEHECSSKRQLMGDDPSVWTSLLDELDSLKADLNRSIKIPSSIMMHFGSSNSRKFGTLKCNHGNRNRRGAYEQCVNLPR